MTKNLLNHDWGSYNSSDSINKLTLENKQDFIDYFREYILPILNIQSINGNIMKIEEEFYQYYFIEDN